MGGSGCVGEIGDLGSTWYLAVATCIERVGRTGWVSKAGVSDGRIYVLAGEDAEAQKIG